MSDKDTASQSQAVPSELASLTGEEIDAIWQSMPGGPSQWLKGFGYQNFAKAVEAEVLLNVQRSLSHSAATGKVPEGWELVPVEPTKEMSYSAVIAAAEFRYNSTGMQGFTHEDSYRAMLAASPAAPLAGKVEPYSKKLAGQGASVAEVRAAERVEAMHEGVVGVFAAIKAEHDTHSAEASADELRAEIKKLTQYKHCMSYNDSYFGEPAGLLKRVAYQLERLIDAAPLAAAVPAEEAKPCLMGEYACSNPAQCWEPCGQLGKSAEHATPADAEQATDELSDEEKAALDRLDKPEWRAASHLKLRAMLAVEVARTIRMGAKIENLQDELRVTEGYRRGYADGTADAARIADVQGEWRSIWGEAPAQGDGVLATDGATVISARWLSTGWATHSFDNDEVVYLPEGRVTHWKPIAASSAAPLAGKAEQTAWAELEPLVIDYAHQLVKVDFWSGDECASSVLMPAYESRDRLRAAIYRSAPLAAAVPAEEASDSIVVPRATLESIYDAMNHMGDALNEIDAVEEEDEDKCTHAFNAIRELLEGRAQAEPAPIQASALTDKRMREIEIECDSMYSMGRAVERELLARLSTPTAQVTGEPASIDTPEFRELLGDFGDTNKVADRIRTATRIVRHIDHHASQVAASARGEALREAAKVCSALASERMEPVALICSDKILALNPAHIAAQAPAGRDAQEGGAQ